MPPSQISKKAHAAMIRLCTIVRHCPLTGPLRQGSVERMGEPGINVDGDLRCPATMQPLSSIPALQAGSLTGLRLHRADIAAHDQIWFCECLHLVDRCSRRDLHELEALRRQVEHAVIGDDSVDTPNPGER